MIYQVGKKQCSNSGRKRNDIDPLESDFMVQPPSLLEFPGPLTPPPPWNFQFPPWWESGYFVEPHNVKLFILWLIEGFRLFNPLSPNIDPQANSPNWSLYISLNNKLREFEKRSKYFLFGDHLINSHNLTSWHCMDIIWRKLMLVT